MPSKKNMASIKHMVYIRLQHKHKKRNRSTLEDGGIRAVVPTSKRNSRSQYAQKIKIKRTSTQMLKIYKKDIE